MIEIKQLNITNPQFDALKTLGYTYIMVAKQRKRIYVTNTTNLQKTSKYAKYDALAISTKRFPMIAIDKMETNIFYKL